MAVGDLARGEAKRGPPVQVKQSQRQRLGADADDAGDGETGGGARRCMKR